MKFPIVDCEVWGLRQQLDCSLRDVVAEAPLVIERMKEN